MTSMTIAGNGLITGQLSTVTLSLKQSVEPGIAFEIEGVRIPAEAEYVVDTSRGVTLARHGKVLSIVEHFLAACAMSGLTNMDVVVQGAPELPLLDGSAQEWIKALSQVSSLKPECDPLWRLSQPLYYQDPQQAAIQLWAIPADHLKLTYLVDFDHPDLQNRWFAWDALSSDTVLKEAVAPARTFGFASELPHLQAMGLAMGVTVENTLGLIETGGYTSALRFSDEAVRHKLLDFIGDMMLCGLPILNLTGHYFIQKAGHTSHIAFAQQLKSLLVKIAQ
jgi:UDP-3-O-[3-hydroxymyristoyl] N-acetylglucosamine deacetylase